MYAQFQWDLAMQVDKYLSAFERLNFSNCSPLKTASEIYLYLIENSVSTHNQTEKAFFLHDDFESVFKLKYH